jgi:hypothetical protein
LIPNVQSFLCRISGRVERPKPQWVCVRIDLVQSQAIEVRTGHPCLKYKHWANGSHSPGIHHLRTLQKPPRTA